MTYLVARPTQVVWAAVLGIMMAVLELLFLPGQALMHGLPEQLGGMFGVVLGAEFVGAVMLITSSVLVMKRTSFGFYVFTALWHVALCVPYALNGQPGAAVLLVPLPAVGLALLSSVRWWFA
jgi:hypothetical protein